MSSVRFLGLSTSTFFMGPMGPGAGRVPQRDRPASGLVLVSDAPGPSRGP